MSGNFAQPGPLPGTNFNGILIRDERDTVTQSAAALIALQQNNQGKPETTDPAPSGLAVAQIEAVAAPNGWQLTSHLEPLQQIALWQFQVLEQHAQRSHRHPQRNGPQSKELRFHFTAFEAAAASAAACACWSAW